MSNVNTIATASRDTRKEITPFAFEIAPELIGQRLASPFQRLVAISIDGLLIGISAHFSPYLVCLLATIACWIGIGKRYLPQLSGWIRLPVRFVAGLISLLALLGVLSELSDWNPRSLLGDDVINLNESFTPEQRHALNKYIDTLDSDCDDDCQRTAFYDLQAAAPETFGAPDTPLDAEEISALNKVAYSIYFLQNFDVSDSVPPSENEINAEDELTDSAFEGGSVVAIEEPAQSTTTSIIEWVKGFLADLGLSFGWAAIYFTLLPIFWKGQTLGKKLMGIKVIALNGTYLNPWDTFGRYGGYGAGFATGLLGFIQVFWDPNRQAIQDKISSTVVIRS